MEKLNKVNDKRKQENDALKQQINDFDDDVMKEEIWELKQENTNLINNEKESLETVGELNESIKYHTAKCDKLKEENDELKQELNDLTSVFDGNVSIRKMKEELKELKEENVKLRKLNLSPHVTTDCWDKLKKEYEDYRASVKAQYKNSHEDNNTELKKAMYDMTMDLSRILSDAETSMIKYVVSAALLKNEIIALKQK